MFRAAAVLEGGARRSSGSIDVTARHQSPARPPSVELGARHRPRGPRRAGHRDQDVLRLRPTSSAASPTPTSTRSPSGLPGSLPVLNRDGGRARHPGRAGPALRGRRVDLRPEELLLPGHAEGLPDQPVRRAAQRRRLARAARRHPVPASSGPTSRRTPASRPTRAATGASTAPSHSLVDYNRAGVPLIEIVGRPDLRSADEARAYVSELRSILVAIGASDGKMEEGSMRVDANVSVRRVGDDELGTRCEIKNVNSLRSLGRAIEYEARRQVDLLEAGERVEPGDPALGRGGRPHPRGALQGGGRGLPLLPRARPGAVGPPTPSGWPRSTPACRVLPAARRARWPRPPGWPRPRWPCTSSATSTTWPWRPSTRAPTPHACSTTSSTTWPSTGAGRSTRPTSPTLVQLESDGTSPPPRPSGAGRDGRERSATRPRSPAPRASRPWTPAPSSPSSTRSSPTTPTTGPSSSTGDDKARGKLTGFFVGQVMKATKGQADGKAVTALLRQRAG